MDKRTIEQIRSEIRELIDEHRKRVKPLQAKLDALMLEAAAEAAPDMVAGQKRRVTPQLNKLGYGRLNEVATIVYPCYSLDRADNDYLAVVVSWNDENTRSTFPIEVVRQMPIVD
jgi:hypothetical protein